MQSYRILLIVAAVALFGAGALITRAVLHRPPPPAVPAVPAAAVPGRQVLVAKTDLSAGQFLQEGDFSWYERPANTLRPELFLQGADNVASLVGSVLLHSIRAGEAIQRGDVVSPRERGFLAAVLPPDKRSITVAVDEVAGNAGLIFPGDHVDMLVTHSDPQAADPSRQVLSEIVLQDVRILAVDQVLRGPTEEVAKETKPGTIPTLPQQAQRKGAARTVTLEVSPRDAGVVAVAVNLGKVTLALRSLAASESGVSVGAGRQSVVWAGDVMSSLGEMRPQVGTAPMASADDGVVLLRGGGH